MQLQGATGRYRVHASYCKDRCCEACANTRRSRIVKNLKPKIGERQTRLLTLTLRGAETPLRTQLGRLYTSARALRRVPQIKAAMTGGVQMLELTYNKTTRCWHPHLHILTFGKYLDHAVIKKHWHRITGDSFIVDIRMVRNAGVAASYVAKYACAPITAAAYHSPATLREAITALRGTRTVNCFGSAKGWKLTDDPQPVEGEVWEPIAPLGKVITDAQNGSREAIAILASLHRSPSNEISNSLHPSQPTLVPRLYDTLDTG